MCCTARRGHGNRAEQRSDRFHLRRDFRAAAGVNHREQVVRPLGQVARTPVAVGDELECTHLRAERVHTVVRHIPDAHAVRDVAERIVVRHRPDAADHARVEHSLQPRLHFVARHSKSPRELVIGPRRERQSALGRDDQPAVARVQCSIGPHLTSHCWLPACSRFAHHATSRISTKYSRSLGNASTVSPVSRSMRAIALSMSAGVSVASTNHMFSGCSGW